MRSLEAAGLAEPWRFAASPLLHAGDKQRGCECRGPSREERFAGSALCGAVVRLA